MIDELVRCLRLLRKTSSLGFSLDYMAHSRDSDAPEVLNRYFSVVHYDGGVHWFHPHRTIENILIAPGMFHTSKVGTNFDLLLKAPEQFTVTNVIIYKGT